MSHVSDHSAVNHRIQVLVCILSHKEALELVLATPQELNIENNKKEARRTSGEIDTGENSGEEAEEETGENKEFGRHREQITASGDNPLEKKVMLLKRMFQECLRDILHLHLRRPPQMPNNRSPAALRDGWRGC